MEATPQATTLLPDLIQEEDCNTLVLYLPGFAKEELKVHPTNTRDLWISGSRKLVENNTLNNFRQDFRVAENYDTSKISAKFEVKDGILYVRQPKYPSKTTPTAYQPPAPRKTDEPAAKKSAHHSPYSFFFF